MDARIASGAAPPYLRRLAATLLAAAVLLAACTGGSAPTPAATPTTAPAAATPTPASAAPPPGQATATATATVAPSASPSPVPVAAGGVAELGLAIERDTRWGDLFETLTAAERSCFREEFGAALDETLAQPLEQDATEAWEVTAFACLAPATARAVLLETVLAGMAEDGVEPGAEERACLRATVAAADIPAVLAAEHEGDPAFAAFAGAFLACLPDVFLDLLLLGAGLEAAGLGAEERACLLEAFDAADWAAAYAGGEGASATFAVELWGCVPALFVSSVLHEEVTLSEADAACLRAVFAALDPAELVAAYEGDGDAAGAAFGEIVSCVPGLMLAGAFGPELGLDLSEAEEACLRDALAGLDWDGRRAVDPDAEIALGVVRCVPDLLLVAMLGQAGAGIDDVGEEELACMREWAAGLETGERLAAVAAGDGLAATALGAGFFACAPGLLVPSAAADPAPAGTAGDATPVAVGASVEGVLDAAGFADRFAFEAERGARYRIDVSPGTLTDPVAVLYDDAWRELASSDDLGDSPGARIAWEATYSGTHYIEVWGYDSGSYSLTVVAR